MHCLQTALAAMCPECWLATVQWRCAGVVVTAWNNWFDLIDDEAEIIQIHISICGTFSQSWLKWWNGHKSDLSLSQLVNKCYWLSVIGWPKLWNRLTLCAGYFFVASISALLACQIFTLAELLFPGKERSECDKDRQTWWHNRNRIWRILHL